MPPLQAIIIGAGAAGLACARTLARRGRSFVVLEGEPEIGGRLSSRARGGFVLDNGFQIFNTAYPELRGLVELGSLHLGSFRSGAWIRQETGFADFPDPLKSPALLCNCLTSPVGTFLDKLRLARFLLRLFVKPVHPLSAHPSRSSAAEFRAQGFSDEFIRLFLRPFWAGVFLDEALETDSRLLKFLFLQFAMGRAALPAGGMGRVATALALPIADRIRVSAPVRSFESGVVTLKDGQTVEGDQVVVACDLRRSPPAHSASTLYFASPRSPLEKPTLVLNPDRGAPIHHLCVPSDVASGYAPPGQSLVSVTHVGPRSPEPGEALEYLRSWFGAEVNAWRHLETIASEKALPTFPSGSRGLPGKVGERIWECGDHTTYPSLNGALESGRKVGEALP